MDNPIIEILTRLTVLLPVIDGKNHSFTIPTETGTPTFYFWVYDKLHFSTIGTDDDLKNVDKFMKDVESYVSSLSTDIED
jgi:hypothetical protein